MKEELTYWITLTFLQGITVRRKNEIYVACYKHEPRITISQLFDDSKLWPELGLSDEECAIFADARTQLANNSFMAEDLLSQGYDILPMDSPLYPKELKANLKMLTPTVLFTKGNKALLQQPAVAIVGSRNADGLSLEFTDNIARRCAAQSQVVVSGFAKGVDTRALTSTLEANGSSIIVLPQGITTFASGLKQFYKALTQGRLLVVSAFYPTAPWSVEMAMRRNPYIYGMAHSIYVAQSDDHGGTWSGAIDGLRKQRPIFVRMPHEDEHNANLQLIQRGAKAVDMEGNELQLSEDQLLTSEEREERERQTTLRQILTSDSSMSSAQIQQRLAVDWSDAKVKKYLRSLDFVEEYRQANKVYFRLKSAPGQLALDL